MSAVVDEAAVRRGIAWLDGQEPTWRERVDPARLDMAQGSYRRTSGAGYGCIGAQLDRIYGSYGHWLDASGAHVAPFERTAWAVAHGFEVEDEEFLDATYAAYAALTEAWLRLAFGREVDADA